MTDYTWSLIITFLIGAVVGISELLSRYPETKYLFKSAIIVSVLYVIFNGLIASFSLLLLWYFKDISAFSVDSIDVGNVLISGLGGMMILRSSLFSVELKDGKAVEIGLIQLVNTFLNVIERKIRNTIAHDKLTEISDVIDNQEFTDFNAFSQAAVMICARFTYHFDKDDIHELEKARSILSTDSSINDREKMIILGGEICKYCDFRMFETVASVLKKGSGSIAEKDSSKIDFMIKVLTEKIGDYGKKE